MSTAKLNVSKRKRFVYEQLKDLAVEAQAFALPPFSDFPVGVAALLWDGRVYRGVNTENPGLELTMHGEMSAVNGSIAAGALRDAERAGLDRYSFIKAIAVTCEKAFEAWPCGHCREFLSSYGTKMDIIVPKADGTIVWKPLSKLYPHAPVVPDLIALTRSGAALKQVQDGSGGYDTLKSYLGDHYPKAYTRNWLLEHARQAANRSYAPYSKRPAGAAIWLYDGTVYGGTRCENVGYTLSKDPVLAALATAVADGALHRAIENGVGQQEFIKAVAYATPGQTNVWPTCSTRQCLCEYGVNYEVIVANAQDKPVAKMLSKLMPGAFVPDALSYWTAAE